jgi:hypothetical protein
VWIHAAAAVPRDTAHAGANGAPVHPLVEELARVAGDRSRPSPVTPLGQEALAPLVQELADPWCFLRRLKEPVRILGGSIPGEEVVLARPDSLHRWYDKGHTLYVTRAERGSESLRAYLQALREVVPHDFGAVGVFVSPEAAVSAWHFDRLEGLNIQLSGAKRWSLAARPRFSDPRDNYGLRELAPSALGYCRDELEAIEAIDVDETLHLSAGTALYVPAGHWHRVESAAGASVSVAFTIRRLARVDLALRALESRLAGDAWWRAAGTEPIDMLLRRAIERDAG